LPGLGLRANCLAHGDRAPAGAPQSGTRRPRNRLRLGRTAQVDIRTALPRVLMKMSLPRHVQHFSTLRSAKCLGGSAPVCGPVLAQLENGGTPSQARCPEQDLLLDWRLAGSRDQIAWYAGGNEVEWRVPALRRDQSAIASDESDMQVSDPRGELLWARTNRTKRRAGQLNGIALSPC
jgi:hypothetical protein